MNAAIFDTIRTQLGSRAANSTVAHGILVLAVEPHAVSGLAQALKSTCGFDMLLDVTAIDWLTRQPRLDVVWHFYSTTHKVRVRVRTQVSEGDPTVDSLTALYGSAAFMERECHEMYGIAFRGHPDLRPILLYEGFVGHPLRKDYPINRRQPLIGPAH